MTTNIIQAAFPSLDSGPPSLVFDSMSATPTTTPMTSLNGVSFAYSTLENALPAILDEVDTNHECLEYIWVKGLETQYMLN